MPALFHSCVHPLRLAGPNFFVRGVRIAPGMMPAVPSEVSFKSSVLQAQSIKEVSRQPTAEETPVRLASNSEAFWAAPSPVANQAPPVESNSSTTLVNLKDLDFGLGDVACTSIGYRSSGVCHRDLCWKPKMCSHSMGGQSKRVKRLDNENISSVSVRQRHVRRQDVLRWCQQCLFFQYLTQQMTVHGEFDPGFRKRRSGNQGSMWNK